MDADPHAPYVENLAAAGDWAGLAQYWIAHQHEAALEAAVACVRRRVLAGEERLQPLLTYLDEVKSAPLGPRHQPPGAVTSRLSETERLTLLLVAIYPQAALCEMALGAPPELQAQLLRLGFEAAERAAQVGLAAGDQAVAAFFLSVLARGRYEVRQMENAVEAWQASLAIYRALAQARPEVYRPYVATTLNNLGTVQSDLNALEAARASYEEALAIRRELAQARPEVYRPDVAMTLNNLGTVQSEDRKSVV